MPTGVAVAIPRGHMGIVVPRSGLALKHGISLVNTPGIIDAAYRGEDNAAVLRDVLGLDDSTIEALARDGVTSSHPPTK